MYLWLDRLNGIIHSNGPYSPYATQLYCIRYISNPLLTFLYNISTLLFMSFVSLFFPGALKATILQSYRYCGSETPPDFFSVGRSVEITFQSDSFNSARGFKLQYKAAGKE